MFVLATRQELAGWSCAHEAELELVALLSAERVRARMETAEQQLRMLNTPGALSLADHLHDAVSGASSSVLWRDGVRSCRGAESHL